MIRQTAKDKDDIRRKEKQEKRQQELLEQNPQQQAKNITIKYTKGLKHQVPHSVFNCFGVVILSIALLELSSCL